MSDLFDLIVYVEICCLPNDYCCHRFCLRDDCR